MSDIVKLIERAQAVANIRGHALATISRKILNDGKGIARLQNGGQCTVKTLANAFELLERLELKAGIHKSIVPNTANQTRSRREGLSHLERLEAESIYIFREVAAECKNPVLLYSAGKDSAVMLHLALKAFHPSKPPFPLLHIDTGWKFKEVTTFRNQQAKKLNLKLIVHKNPMGAAQNINPLNQKSSQHTDMMKTQALKQALDKYGFDAAFGGARRDEEKSRAKERVFSFRNTQHHWNPKNQRPELWNLYNTRVSKGENVRVFPLSNWTELDIWQYIYKHNIQLPNLYFAKPRPIIERDNVLIMVDDDRMVLAKNEIIQEKMVRFRTLGCYPLTGAIESQATTLPEIIQEILLAKTSERYDRAIDKNNASSMEMKKSEGYF